MSDQLSAPRDPGSYGSRRRTGLGVGALVLFGIVCVAGGYSLARFGPTLPELYPDKPRAGAVAEIAPLAAPAPAALVDEAPPPSDPIEVSRSLPLQIEALRVEGALEQVGAHPRVRAAILSAFPEAAHRTPTELVRIGRALPVQRWTVGVRTLPRAQRGTAYN